MWGALATLARSPCHLSTTIPLDDGANDSGAKKDHFRISFSKRLNCKNPEHQHGLTRQPSSVHASPGIITWGVKEGKLSWGVQYLSTLKHHSLQALHTGNN